MAIVSLGTNTVDTGTQPIIYAPFSYDSRRAYGIYVLCTSANFNSIFSFIRIRAQIEPNTLTPFIESTKYDFDIIPQLQFFFLPFSRLFDNDGDCTLLVTRPPRWKGGGDGTEVTVELSYDDAVDVPSWRD